VDTFLQQLVNGLTAEAFYAVVALGYTMVYGIIQLINFAHGEVVMIGAMVAFTVINALAPTGLSPLAVVLVAPRAQSRYACWSATRWSGSRTGRCAARRAWRRSSPRSAFRSSCAPGDAGLESQRAGVSTDHRQHQLHARRRVDHERADRDHRGVRRVDGRARATRVSHAARHRDARHCAKTRRSQG